jgi:hypothetical protein
MNGNKIMDKKELINLPIKEVSELGQRDFLAWFDASIKFTGVGVKSINWKIEGPKLGLRQNIGVSLNFKDREFGNQEGFVGPKDLKINLSITLPSNIPTVKRLGAKIFELYINERDGFYKSLAKVAPRCVQKDLIKKILDGQVEDLLREWVEKYLSPIYCKKGG